MAEEAKDMSWYRLWQSVYTPSRQPEINADDILAEILEGKDVTHKDVIIKGDLDLDKLALKTDAENRRIINSRISIVNCAIKEKLTFPISSFEKLIDFSGSRFEGDTNFSRSHFRGETKFIGSQFEEYADFSESQFKGDAIFVKSQFKGNADFNRSQFRGDAEFIGSQFKGETKFIGSQFKGDAIFFESQFNGTANFWESQFEGYADFSRSQFKGDAIFFESQFKGNADFLESQFKGETCFSGSQFKGETKFIGSQFEGYADFRDSEFDRKISFDNFIGKKTRFNGYLNLDNCKINSMSIDAEFDHPSERQISLKYPDLNHLFAHWDSIKNHIQYDGSTYLALVKNYNNLEWFEDADQCYYEYRKLSQNRKDWNWSKLLDWIAFVSCGYGVRLRFVLGWMVGLILLFGFINLFSGISAPESAFMSTIAFTASLPNNALISNNLRYAFIVERFLGTILIALFVVVLTKKLIR